MGLRNRARRVYARHKEGTYQARDLRSPQDDARHPAVVHEEVAPAAPIFDPLPNHQGAPVQNPVTNAPVTDANTQDTDDGETEAFTVRVDLTQEEKNAFKGCFSLCVGILIIGLLIRLAYWVASVI